MGEAAMRWAAELAAWAIPPEILDRTGVPVDVPSRAVRPGGRGGPH